MSFIPGEGSETLTIASQAGSGIGIQLVSDVNYLTANLIAGTNITLVPSVLNTSITISSSGAGGGIASVSSGVGSGIDATTVGAGVNLTSALVAGTGIQLVASGVNNNLTINNTQSITTATGSGITATTTGGSTALVANLTAGNGITITPSVANTSKMISNAGVLELTAGAGISITGAKSNYTINATGSGATTGNFVRNTTPTANSFNIVPSIFYTITPLMASTFAGSVSGILFSSAGTPYLGGQFPPALYSIAWSAPVSIPSTPNSPGTQWVYDSVISVKYRLINKNFGTNVVNAVLDEGNTTGFAILDRGSGIPYFSFHCIATALVSSSAGDGTSTSNNIGFEFAMAGESFPVSPANTSYSFDPAGIVSDYEYVKVGAMFIS